MNRALTAATLTLGLAACGGALEAPQAEGELQLHAADTLPTTLQPYDLVNLSNVSTRTCIETPNFKTDSGTAMKPGTCNERASFAFSVNRLPTGNYVFENYLSKKCLAVAGDDLADGAKVIQADCTDSPSQQFRAIEITSGAFELRAAHSDKCLDLDAWGNVQQWGCWGGTNQRWSVNLAARSKIEVAASPGSSTKKALDADGSSFTDGGTVMQWDYWGGVNQQWFVLRFADGSVELKARHNGKCLAIVGAGLDNGTLAQQWTCDGQPSRRFNLRSVGSGRGYQVQPKHSNKCVDRPEVSNRTNGALIQQWACSGGTNQIWFFSSL